MNDYNIKQYFDNVIKITNSSGLTPGEAYFVLRCVTNELEKAYLETSQTPPSEREQEFTQEIDTKDIPDNQDKAD